MNSVKGIEVSGYELHYGRAFLLISHISLMDMHYGPDDFEHGTVESDKCTPIAPEATDTTAVQEQAQEAASEAVEKGWKTTHQVLASFLNHPEYKDEDAILGSD